MNPNPLLSLPSLRHPTREHRTALSRNVAKLGLAALCAVFASTAPSIVAQDTQSRGVVDPHIRVDQFGYHPLAVKRAVLREPVTGFDAPQPFTPSNRIELRRATNGQVVFASPPSPHAAGTVHAESGDRAWRFDFTAVDEPGEYIVVDTGSGRSSAPFRIADDVYGEALRAAVRMYFYQRCGVAKAVPHAHPNWSDSPCHLGNEQDSDCRLVSDPSPSTSRDLSGGWHDAGDYNKYVNFADGAVHTLLHAYSDNPSFWADGTLNIPESGNGVPDLLDEVRFELDWLLKMQLADGSVLHKISVTDFSAASPPSADAGPRRYAPPTASATISACAVFAHAAMIYGNAPNSAAFATTLQNAALQAWSWLAANPAAIPSSYNNAGFVNVAAEDTAYDQLDNRIQAAIWLFALTNQPAYRAFVDQNYTSLHLVQWGWASPYEPNSHAAILTYTDLPLATANVAAAVRQTYLASVSTAHLGLIQADSDPYEGPLLAQDYVWGSNKVKCDTAQLFLNVARHGLDAALTGPCTDAAEGYVHAMHGLNPLGLTYLTNVHSLGAEGSVAETYHGWFAEGTVFDNARTSPRGPAPGFLVGGPNPSFAPDAAYTGPPIVPPQQQPARKAYRDWNTGYPENSWAISECHIPYQASYVRLLASFAAAPAPRIGFAAEAPTTTAGASAALTVANLRPQQLHAVLWSGAPGRAQLTVAGWAFDLGIGLFSPPGGNVLFWGFADPNGQAIWNLPALPPVWAGSALHLQTSALRRTPLQSSVLVRTVR